MRSTKTIPSSEIIVSDGKAKKDNLRPGTEVAMTSSDRVLLITYTPTNEKPVTKVKIVSAENIEKYTVRFFNADGDIVNRYVRMKKISIFRLSI